MVNIDKDEDKEILSKLRKPKQSLGEDNHLIENLNK